MPSWKKVITSGSDAALNSLNVTTSLTASGNIYPTGLGVDRQILKTDGVGNISFGYAEEIVAIVKNVSGGTLQKGTPVHATASGASGNIVGIIAASASDASTMPATFVLNDTLNDGDEGEALSSGFIQGVNTAAFEVGQIVYVGESGGYTGTKPTGSNLIQNLGVVTKVGLTNGSGYILGAGRSNDLPNIQPGYMWVGNENSVPTATATSSIQNVVSASYALSASYAPGGNPFPFTGDAQISGSLGVTGSFSVLDSIDGTNKILISTNTTHSIDWENRYLHDSYGTVIVDWASMALYDDNATYALNWSVREAYDIVEVSAINWDARRLFDSSGAIVMRWDQRLTYDTVDSQSIDWNIRQLKFDNDASDYTVDWNEGILQDTAAKFSVDWQNRQLKNSSGDEVLNWSSGVAITGSLTVSGSSTFTNIGPAQFSGSFGIQGAGDGYDVLPIPAITIDDANYTRTLHDSLTGASSLDFGNRSLVDVSGNFVLSWDGTKGYIYSELYSNSRITATTRNTLLGEFASAGQTLDEVTFDSTVADFDLVYLSTGSTWFPVDQATDSSTKLLGICLGYDPGTGLGTVILEGDVSVSTSAGSAPVVDNANYGLPVYIANGAGNTMDTTIPVDGYVRVLGHCYHTDDDDNWIMKFRPSNDWIEI